MFFASRATVHDAISRGGEVEAICLVQSTKTVERAFHRQPDQHELVAVAEGAGKASLYRLKKRPEATQGIASDRPDGRGQPRRGGRQDADGRRVVRPRTGERETRSSGRSKENTEGNGETTYDAETYVRAMERVLERSAKQHAALAGEMNRMRELVRRLREAIRRERSGRRSGSQSR